MPAASPRRRSPPFQTGPTAWITHFAGSLPARVTTAWPTAHVPIWSHSSWMVGPPCMRIAPATPEPSCSASFAALTIASTCVRVRSDFESSMTAGMRIEARPQAPSVLTIASAIRR